MQTEDKTSLAVIPVHHIQPDDVIICRHQGCLTAHQLSQIRQRISENFPGHKILIHDSRAEISIQRPTHHAAS